MHNRLHNHIKNLLLPCLGFSMAAGFLSAIFVTAFKLAAEVVIHLSTALYGIARTNNAWFPILVLGAAAIGFAASLVLSISHSCRGGGIPTAVAAIRGIISFKWVASIFVLPFSALLSFFCGLPLGTEGPCVQMGTAIGDGVVRCFGSKKHEGWRRYIMTGGACAGFSIATSSPITAIIFVVEELHKHFSPMLLTVAAISVMTAQTTLQILAFFGIGTVRLFHLPEILPTSPKFLFAPLLVGLICGICSILFTRFYYLVDKFMHTLLKKLSPKIVFPVLFSVVAIVGFFLTDACGTGHSLVDKLLGAGTVWYLLILVFLIRMIFMMASNTSGATGGVFLPTLAFGAILGALCAKVMLSLGLIDSEHYILMVILGITAFLGATSRIPITACVFAVEALNGINNILPIIIATTVALLVAEMSGIEDFTDAVIDAKIRTISKGKEPSVVEASLTVTENSFVVGKELCDILWPNSCVVISFESTKKGHNRSTISAGDIITVRYETYDPAATAEELKILVGDETEQVKLIINPCL